MRLAAALALASLLAAAPAAAQDRGADDVTQYDFEDDLVNGGRYEPLGEILEVRRRHGRRTLIQTRAHFIPEMLQSVERL